VNWRVVIVEDDALARDFFRSSVERCTDLRLLAAVGSVAEARACLDGLGDAGVDVLLTDINLPDGTGLEVIRHALARHPGCEPLVISMFGDEDTVLSAIEAGAMGYIHKDTTPDDIAGTILAMKDGASPISPMIARRVLSRFRQMRGGAAAELPLQAAPGNVAAEPVAAPDAAERPNLSTREQEVLELIARGFSYAEIARIKNISVHTVQTHIKGLYGKLEVHSKNEAVYEATRIGLL
jgi:DNA-binding NarL/FixJ family response regulator